MISGNSCFSRGVAWCKSIVTRSTWTQHPRRSGGSCTGARRRASSGPVETGEFGPICRKIEHGPVTIEILHEGDENSAGLVRHCFFRVPKYLLSGGVAQSWEHITEVVPYVSAKYYAIGKPLWSRAEGEHRLEPLPDGTTRVHFVERYHVFNPLMRLLLERRVHQFISKDNDKLVRAGVEQALAATRRVAQRVAPHPAGIMGAVLLAQISDTHLLSDPGASAWGQNPAENLASVMRALPPVDVLVATGDIVDDGTIEAYRLADALTRRGAVAATSSRATTTTPRPWRRCSARPRTGDSSSCRSTGRWGC